MTLAALAPGQSARIVALRPRADQTTLCRLAELGFTEGVGLTLVRRAPLGDPLVVRILNYDLCIRATEAVSVEVELMEAGQGEQAPQAGRILEAGA